MAFLFSDDKTRIDLADAIQPYLTALQTSFQASINSIYQKLVTLGSTPADKTLNSILNAIQGLTEKTWNQSLSIEQITWSDSEGSHSLNFRDIPFTSKNVVNIGVSFAYYAWNPFGTVTLPFGTIKWYNSSGTLLKTDDISVEAPPNGTNSYNRTFTPPSGAVRGEFSINYRLSIGYLNNTPTLSFKYQTKVLR